MYLFILKVYTFGICNYSWHNEIYDQPTYQTKQLLVPTIGYGRTEGFFKLAEFKSDVMRD